MTVYAFVLIFISAFFHAGWNFINKSTGATIAFYMFRSIAAALIWLPWLFILKTDLTSFGGPFWIMLLISVASNMIYFFGLTFSYKFSGISQAYPLIRAIPVVLVAVISVLFGIGKQPDSIALAGMVIITLGCLLIPLKKFSELKPANYMQKSLLFVLIAACGTVGYTFSDSASMKLLTGNGQCTSMQASIIFTALEEFLLAVGLAIWTFLDRKEFAASRSVVRKVWWPCLSGLCSSLAYILVLIAMTYVTNVCYVQAFRQLSLPVGVFMGIVFLKEKHGLVKMTGVALIVIGLVMTAF